MLSQRSEWEEFLNRRKSKIALITALITLGMVIVILRLWHLQIVEHSDLSTRAENNRIRQVTLDGRRGKILDRNGRPLVDSRPSFQISVIPEDIDDPKKTLGYLRKTIEFDLDETLKRIKRAQSFEQVVIKRDINRTDVAFIEENRLSLPGVSLQIKAIRNYIYGNLASHFLGYLSAITPRQLEAVPERVYSRDDFVGQFGIEKTFEEVLRGYKGLKRVEVDAAGRALETMGEIHPRSGSDLRLTIDYEAQKAAEEAFEDKMGAAIAIDPNNGDVLAYVSKPSFDPNTFSYGISSKNWKKLVTDEFHPLQNRVTQGQYPPGSTFKIITTVAALEEGLVDENSRIFCPGHFRLGNRTYRCWKKVGHGWMNVRQALIQSCDVYFYTVGLKLGINRIAKYARMFGLGSVPKLKLGVERSGLVPTTQWKKRARKENWIIGETVSCSIGQGYNLVTPAQQARMIAAVANGGWLVTPRIVNGDENLEIDGSEPRENDIRLPISEGTMKLLAGSLRGVVSAPHGTAWRLKKSPFNYAGKTGTSQVIRMKKEEPKDIEEIKFKYRDHAWFVSYGPIENPRIAVAVIAEHSGHGGEAAAPIAQKIMDAYLNELKRKNPSFNQVLEPVDGKGLPTGPSRITNPQGEAAAAGM